MVSEAGFEPSVGCGSTSGLQRPEVTTTTTVDLGGGLSAPNVSESPTSPERSKGAELHEDAGSKSLAAVGPFSGGDSGEDPVAVKSPVRVKSKQTAPVMVDQADDRVILLQRTPAS
jgi:hypothetical protein